MNAATQVICSCALTYGAPMLIAAWELWKLGPSQQRRPPGEAVPPAPTPLPGPGVAPYSHKPLPDCLIPKPIPARLPELV